MFSFSIVVFRYLLLAAILHSAWTGVRSEMAHKRKVPFISTRDDLEKNLPGYLNKSQKLALLLDYDGTLAPLVDNPDNATMPRETEDSLRRIIKNPNIFVSVISGRGLADVKYVVGLSNVTYAGNHGIEIELPDGTRADYELPPDVKAEYEKLVKELQEKAAQHGAWVEDKHASLTFHYRNTPKEFVESLREETIKIIEKHGFRASDAHCAIEGKPPVNWNKGEAALYILKRKFGEDWKNSIKVIFIGDDTTDEDAMKALQGIGKTFRISTDPNIETYADYRISSPYETAMLLQWIESVYS